MSYRYLEDFATADIAFEAFAESLPELFMAASDATMNVMIEDIDAIKPVRRVDIELEDREPDMLLFDLLQELIFRKDADQLLLRVQSADIESESGILKIRTKAVGEILDPLRHKQRVDVKAVTLHNYVVEQLADGSWRALVILDV
jgi:SHS2 domain-containing protein